MTAKKLIKDLCKNIEFLIKSSKDGLFSEYWLMDFVSSKVETLGKLLIASYDVLIDKSVSKYAFTYAILKLESFKDYRQYIKTFDGSRNINTDYSRDNTNIAVSESLVNNREYCQNNWDLYEMLRCKFQHQSAPQPYNNSSVIFTKNARPTENNGILTIGAIDFANDFKNACNELINIQDNNVQAFISRLNYLPINISALNPPVSGIIN